MQMPSLLASIITFVRCGKIFYLLHTFYELIVIYGMKG